MINKNNATPSTDTSCFTDKDLEETLKIYCLTPSPCHEANSNEFESCDNNNDKWNSVWKELEKSESSSYWKNLLCDLMRIIKNNALYKNLMQFYNSSNSSQNQLIADFIEEYPESVKEILTYCTPDRVHSWLMDTFIEDCIREGPWNSLYLTIKSDGEIDRMEPNERKSYLVSTLKKVALVNLIRNLACRIERLFNALGGKLPEENGNLSCSQISEALITSPYATKIEAKTEDKLAKTGIPKPRNANKNDKDITEAVIEDETAMFVLHYDQMFAFKYRARNEAETFIFGDGLNEIEELTGVPQILTKSYVQGWSGKIPNATAPNASYCHQPSLIDPADLWNVRLAKEYSEEEIKLEHEYIKKIRQPKE